MANPVIRESGQLTPVAAQTGSFATSSAVQAGDLLVLAHMLDYYAATNLLTPTGGAGTWALQATADAGATNPSIKVWTLPVTSSGVQSVTVAQTAQGNPSNYSTHFAHWWVINATGATLSVDGTPAVVNGTTAATAQTIGSVSPVGSDDLQLAAIATGTFASGTYTTPAGMTLVAQQDNPGFCSVASYRQQLTAAGATGTKTATFSASQPWCSATLAIRSVAASAPPALPPRIRAVRTAVQRGAVY